LISSLLGTVTRILLSPRLDDDDELGPLPVLEESGSDVLSSLLKTVKSVSASIQRRDSEEEEEVVVVIKVGSEFTKSTRIGGKRNPVVCFLQSVVLVLDDLGIG